MSHIDGPWHFGNMHGPVWSWIVHTGPSNECPQCWPGVVAPIEVWSRFAERMVLEEGE